MIAIEKIRAAHAAAAAYFEENDVPGGWLTDDGSWKDWESESEGAASEARRDALAEVLGLLDAETIDATAALQHEIRETAHEVAGLTGLANTCGIVLDRDQRRAARLYVKVLEDSLRALHAQLSRAENVDELREAAMRSIDVLRVREGWRSE